MSLFGSREIVAEICRRHVSAVSHWRRAGLRRAAGDVPTAVMERLLAHARAHGIPLTAEHLIFGASRAELDALLAQVGRPAPPASPMAAE